MKILSTLSVDKKRRVPAIDTALFEPIGEMTVNFAMLEQTLKHGIHRLLFPDGDEGWEDVTGSIVTSEMSFRRLTDLFRCLVEHRCSDEDQETCRALCVEMYRLEERRNSIIHSHWAIDANTKGTVRLKTTAKGKGLKHQEQPIKRGDIACIAEDLARLAKDLEDFLEPHGQRKVTGSL
jgi:hypothetical protein